MGLRERKKAQRRLDILTAAFRLFAEKGYETTTIADIAREADVAPRTVLLYFDSKKDLALSPVVETQRRIFDEIRARPVGDTVLDAYRTWVIKELRRNDSPVMQLAHQMYETNPELRALKDAQLACSMDDGLQVVAEAMGLDEDDPRPRLVLAAVKGLTSELLINGGQSDPAEQVDFVVRFLEGGMSAVAAPPDAP